MAWPDADEQTRNILNEALTRSVREPLSERQALVGVAWKRLDGTTDQSGIESQDFIWGEPPGVAG